MNTLGTILMALGWLSIASGLVLDIVAALAMTSFERRQKLPVNSPIDLYGYSGVLFVLGVGCIVLSNWITS